MLCVPGDVSQEYLPSIPGCGVIPESIYNVVEVVPGESFVAQMGMPAVGVDLEGGTELHSNAPVTITLLQCGLIAGWQSLPADGSILGRRLRPRYGHVGRSAQE
jgi:hypothetical protein